MTGWMGGCQWSDSWEGACTRVCVRVLSGHICITKLDTQSLDSKPRCFTSGAHTRTYGDNIVWSALYWRYNNVRSAFHWR